MKKYFLIFMMIFLLYIPSTVYGEELTGFKFNAVASPRVVDAAGADTTIKISIATTNTTNPITGCKFKMNFSENAQYVSFAGSNNWKETAGQEYSLTSNEGVIATSSDAEASTVIGNVSVKVNGESKVTFSDITCYDADHDISSKVNDVEVSLRVADNIIVKIDGSVVQGGIYSISPSTKDSFVLSVTSQSSDSLNNASVKAINTMSGEKLLCNSSSLSNCTINFSNDNFCTSGDLCLGAYSSVGDVINIVISDTNNSFKEISILVSREKSGGDEQYYTDSTISRLNVYGNEITLVDGQNDYTTTVYGTLSEYSVSATLSDPEHYEWDAESNPSNYNYPETEINLLVVPKDDKLLGGNKRPYRITVVFENDSSSSSEQILPPSSSYVAPSSSTMDNPHTGASGFATFIVAFILFAALIISLRTYNRNME